MISWAHNFWIVVAANLLAGIGIANAKDLVFGQLASTTNPLVAEISKAMTQGYQLAFDRVNAAGGINGNQMRLLVKDDQFNSEEGGRLAKEMIEKSGITAFVGCVGTPVINVLAREKTLTANDIAYVGPFSGSSAALKTPNVFAVRATYESELERIFQMTQTMYQKRVAFFYFNAGIGPVMSGYAQTMALRHKLELVSNAGFEVNPDTSLQTASVKQALMPYAKSRPDAVIVIAAGKAMWSALKQVRENYGPSIPVYSISTVTTDDIIRQIGAKDAHGVIVSQAMPSPQGLDRKIVVEYQDDIKKFGKGMKPGYVTLEGYVGGRVLAEAVKFAGANPSRESVLAALYGLGERNLDGIGIKYGRAERQGNVAVDMVVIGKGGALIR